jgi:hypothetical protein
MSDNACLQEQLLHQRSLDQRKCRPDIGRLSCNNEKFLFQGFQLRIGSSFNAVGSAARPFDKASDRKLRSALYVQATQVTRYVGRGKACKSAVFKVEFPPRSCLGAGRPEDLGFLTTKAVWLLEPETRDSPGVTCESREFLSWAQDLQSLEIYRGPPAQKISLEHLMPRAMYSLSE